jgi:hypothetical protein
MTRNCHKQHERHNTATMVKDQVQRPLDARPTYHGSVAKVPSVLAFLVFLVALHSFFLLPEYDQESNLSHPINTLDKARRRPDSPKHRTKNSSSSNNNTNNNATLLFVHVGKAGGETIKWRLKVICNLRASRRKRAICQEQFESGAGGAGGDGESELSKHTIGYMHCNSLRPKTSLPTATTLLFSVRDPMNRIISWFQYMHPLNCLPERPSAACNLKKEEQQKQQRQQDETTNGDESSSWGHVMFHVCFHDVNDMLQALRPTRVAGGDDESSKTKDKNTCSAMALDTVQGRGPPGPSNHLFFNYNFYAKRTLVPIASSNASDPTAMSSSSSSSSQRLLGEGGTTKTIVVVRQEALWDDLRSIEAMLGGNRYRSFETEGPVVTHGSEMFPYKAVADPTLIPILCCAISNELGIYVDLIQRAQNLEPTQRLDSIRRLQSKCGVLNDNDTSGNDGDNGPTAALDFMSLLDKKCQKDAALAVAVVT